MYSCPGATSTGTMCPGNFVQKANSPAEPMARYSVMKIDPPPATRLSTPNSPPPPPNWVCVVIWIVLPIHDNSPASEIIVSLGSRANSSTGMVVPVIRLCIRNLLITAEYFAESAFQYTCVGVNPDNAGTRVQR